MTKHKTKGTGLKALEGKDLVGYKELSEATGLEISTIQGYNTRRRGDKPRLMPKSDKPGVWRTDRQDLKDWITGESRPGPGARTDLYPQETN